MQQPVEHEERYYTTDDVRYCIVDQSAYILDLRDGEYVHLDRAATAMWQVLLSVADPGTRVSALQRTFDAPAEQLAADLRAFAEDCVRRKYLTPTPSESSEPTLDKADKADTADTARATRKTRQARGRVPRCGLPLRAWWALAGTARRLRRTGFASTYSRYRSFPKPAADPTREALERAERAFAFAENFFVMRAAPKDCLPRSLALYRFMLACGVSVEHCIGVRTQPFEAHAWVESAGTPLRDSQRFVETFTKIAAL